MIRTFLAAALVAAGPLLAPLIPGAVPPLAIAAVAVAALVAVVWFGEACDVPPKVAAAVGGVAAAVVSAALSAWTFPLVVWLLALALVASAFVADADDEPIYRVDEAIPEEETDVEARPEEAESPPAVSQSRRTVEGRVTIEGVAECEDGLNHVVFHPPLDRTPTAKAFALDEGCKVSVSEATPHGLRLTARGRGFVAYEASEPADSSISSQTSP